MCSSSPAVAANRARPPWPLWPLCAPAPGLVTAAVPESILPSVAAITPELMTFPLREGPHGEADVSNLQPDVLKRLTERATVIAMGPGLGTEPEAFVLGLIEKTRLPLVLDADALNILAKHPEKIDGRKRTMVLTPHPGEMARLAGISTKEVQARREPLAREFATRSITSRWFSKAGAPSSPIPMGGLPSTPPAIPAWPRAAAATFSPASSRRFSPSIPIIRTRPSKPPFTCMGWRPTSPCASRTSTPCWPPTPSVIFLALFTSVRRMKRAMFG